VEKESLRGSWARAVGMGIESVMVVLVVVRLVVVVWTWFVWWCGLSCVETDVRVVCRCDYVFLAVGDEEWLDLSWIA